jgi:hypothetical protein
LTSVELGQSTSPSVELVFSFGSLQTRKSPFSLRLMQRLW